MERTIHQLFADLAKIDALKGNLPKFPDVATYMMVYRGARHHIICDFWSQLQTVKIELIKRGYYA